MTVCVKIYEAKDTIKKYEDLVIDLLVKEM